MDIVGGDGDVLRDSALHRMHLGQIMPRGGQTRLSAWPLKKNKCNGKESAILRSPRPLILIALTLLMLATSTEAALINFSNCLDPLKYSPTPLSDTDPDPSHKVLLQWFPEALSATFNLTAPYYNLNLTSFGNVTGQATDGTLQPGNNTDFWSSNQTLGKIDDLNNVTLLRTTLFSRFNVLSYTPWKADPAPFCESLFNNTTRCPLAPIFNA